MLVMTGAAISILYEPSSRKQITSLPQTAVLPEELLPQAYCRSGAVPDLALVWLTWFGPGADQSLL